MKRAVAHVDHCYFYDNSVDSKPPTLLFRTRDGKVAKVYTTPLPQWSAHFYHSLPQDTK